MCDLKFWLIAALFKKESISRKEKKTSLSTLANILNYETAKWSPLATPCVQLLPEQVSPWVNTSLICWDAWGESAGIISFQHKFFPGCLGWKCYFVFWVRAISRILILCCPSDLPQLLGAWLWIPLTLRLQTLILLCPFTFISGALVCISNPCMHMSIHLPGVLKLLMWSWVRILQTRLWPQILIMPG